MSEYCDLSNIADDLIREGVEAAAERTLIPAAPEKAYPGHFMVTADGKYFGTENTWPGLDSWEIAGAFLLLGRERLVLDYFDFVQASQRKDGNIPFAVFSGSQIDPGMQTLFPKLRLPEDLFTYRPAPRPGRLEHSDLSERTWLRLFDHWQWDTNPLTVLGPVSYLLTAREIADRQPSTAWLHERIDSLEKAAQYVLTRRDSGNGLIGGSGFYTECPPRYQWDGVTQCYTVRAFRDLAAMYESAGRVSDVQRWQDTANEIAASFRSAFWQKDHFGEYVHPEHGLVDLHGLTDVNWAAIGLDVATDDEARILWPRLTSERAFHHGGMPTQPVTRPYGYREWELPKIMPHEHMGPLYDVAAMGRVWYLESLACVRMKDFVRLRDTALSVCRMGKCHDWVWYERYHPLQTQQAGLAGAHPYCEYAAILVRVVLGYPEAFA